MPSIWQPMLMVSTLIGQASTSLRWVTARADTFGLNRILFKKFFLTSAPKSWPDSARSAILMTMKRSPLRLLASWHYKFKSQVTYLVISAFWENMRSVSGELLANLARKLPPKRVASMVVTKMWMRVSMMPAGQLASG